MLDGVGGHAQEELWPKVLRPAMKKSGFQLATAVWDDCICKVNIEIWNFFGQELSLEDLEIVT